MSFAKATTDSGFKHMLNDTSIVISFLTAFAPGFRANKVTLIEAAPTAIPPLKQVGIRQTFMDLHFRSGDGTHYVLEMQVCRKEMFDYRALFYACSTFSGQLSEKVLGTKEWYSRLKPVIAIHVLDYNTAGDTRELLSEPADCVSHFCLNSKSSNQTIDALQVVQIVLPRAEEVKKLYPPAADFTLVEWWLSILLHSTEYGSTDIQLFYHNARTMPESIYKALMQLKLQYWNPDASAIYSQEVCDRNSGNENFSLGTSRGIRIGMDSMKVRLRANGVPENIIRISAEEAINYAAQIVQEKPDPVSRESASGSVS